MFNYQIISIGVLMSQLLSTMPIPYSTLLSAGIAQAASIDLSVVNVQSRISHPSIPLFLSLENKGQSSVSNGEVTFTLPNSLQLEGSKSSSACEQNGNSVSCKPLFIAPGTALRMPIMLKSSKPYQCQNGDMLTINVRIPGSNTIVTTHTVGQYACDTLLVIPGLETSVTLENSVIVKPGDVVTFRLNIRNNSTLNIVKSTAYAHVDTQYSEILSGQTGELCTDNGYCINMPLNIGANYSNTIKYRIKNDAPCFTVINGYAGYGLWSANLPGRYADQTIHHDEFQLYVTCPIPEPPKADVSMEKSGPATVGLGGTIQYNLKVRNSGPNTAERVIVRDTVPGGLTFESASGPSNCSAQGTEVVCSPISLTNGQEQTYTLSFRVPSSVASCNATIINFAQVSTDTFEENSGNNSDVSDATRIICGEITIEKTANVSKSPKNGQVVYTIKVESESDVGAQGVVVRDTVPSGLQFVAGQSDNRCSVSGTVITCGPVDISGRNSAQFQLTFTVLASAVCGSAITNIATATATNISGQVQDDAVVTVECAPPKFTIVKSVDKAQIEPGESLVYTIIVKNIGDTTANYVELIDFFPSNAGVTYDSNGSGPSCTKNGTGIVCHVDTLAPNAEVSFTIRVKTDTTVACDSTISNKAKVEAVNATRVDSNTVETDVVCKKEPKLTATKQVDKTTVNPGESITYTIRIENTGNATANNVAIQDTIPTTLHLESGRSDAKCSVTGSTVNCGPYEILAGGRKTLVLVFTFLP